MKNYLGLCYIKGKGTLADIKWNINARSRVHLTLVGKHHLSIYIRLILCEHAVICGHDIYEEIHFDVGGTDGVCQFKSKF